MARGSYLGGIRQGIDAQIKELEAQGIHPRARAGTAPETPSVEDGQKPELSSVALPEESEDEKSHWPLNNQPSVFGQASAIGRAGPLSALAPQLTPDQQAEIEKRRMQAKLQNRMYFLSTLRDKLDEDPELFNFVDSMITNQVKAAEKRQRTYSAVVTTFVSVLSLIAGWLLSAVSPASAVARMLGH